MLTKRLNNTGLDTSGGRELRNKEGYHNVCNFVSDTHIYIFLYHSSKLIFSVRVVVHIILQPVEIDVFFLKKGRIYTS